MSGTRQGIRKRIVKEFVSCSLLTHTASAVHSTACDWWFCIEFNTELIPNDTGFSDSTVLNV